MPIPRETLDKAKHAASAIDADVFFYNGELKTGPDLTCIEQISAAKHRSSVLLFLTTHGGDPDAAYKIARYLQERYEKFTLVVAGKCKSAGTLLAVGAHEIAFTPYGELGPLDIQLSKVDKFDHMESGLAIQDSLETLQKRAVNEYMTMVQSYIRANNGLLSFGAATDAAAKIVTGLFAPILSRIDPEEVGARARSMRIASDYGRRLEARSQNLAKATTLKTLAETYPSHSFVIDQQEAAELFKNVRPANAAEVAVIEALGTYARFETGTAGEVVIQALSSPPTTEEKPHEGPKEGGGPKATRGNSAGAGGKAIPAKPSSGRRPSAGHMAGNGRGQTRGNGVARPR